MGRTTSVVGARVPRDVAARLRLIAAVAGRTPSGYLAGLVTAAVGNAVNNSITDLSRQRDQFPPGGKGGKDR